MRDSLYDSRYNLRNKDTVIGNALELFLIWLISFRTPITDPNSRTAQSGNNKKSVIYVSSHYRAPFGRWSTQWRGKSSSIVIVILRREKHNSCRLSTRQLFVWWTVNEEGQLIKTSRYELTKCVFILATDRPGPPRRSQSESKIRLWSHYLWNTLCPGIEKQSIWGITSTDNNGDPLRLFNLFQMVTRCLGRNN